MKKIIIVFLILFIIGYFLRDNVDNLITGNIISEEIEEGMIPKDFGEINLYFCPSDDCENALVGMINKSSEVNCAFFELNLDKVIDTLKDKNYRLVVDDRYIGKVIGNLSNFKSDGKQGLMHNKFCTFDVDGRKFISTGSMNPTFNDVGKNNNNLVVIESKNLYENYLEEFNEMWNGEFGSGMEVKTTKIYFNGFLIENYFCPEDRCEKKVLDVLKMAKNRIYFMTFSFTSDMIGDEIVRNWHEGIDVKGVFEKMQAGSEFSEYEKMKDLGMDVKVDSNPKLLHHKVFIADDIVILGSYNPTSSGDKKNDENVLIIHNKEIAEKFVEEFEIIFYPYKNSKLYKSVGVNN
ncbi:MAG: phospholipase D-like domain-containing protein [Nanoarchaeota archaeon]